MLGPKVCRLLLLDLSQSDVNRQFIEDVYKCWPVYGRSEIEEILGNKSFLQCIKSEPLIWCKEVGMESPEVVHVLNKNIQPSDSLIQSLIYLGFNIPEVALPDGLVDYLGNPELKLDDLLPTVKSSGLVDKVMQQGLNVNQQKSAIAELLVYFLALGGAELLAGVRLLWPYNYSHPVEFPATENSVIYSDCDKTYAC